MNRMNGVSDVSDVRGPNATMAMIETNLVRERVTGFDVGGVHTGHRVPAGRPGV
ncbi:MAG: hypothetical protein JNL30_18450 [Rubrivivax sp.]|nr:hypothetical protein [Rubrivivax sp.]